MEPYRTKCGRLARNKTNRKAVQSETIGNGMCPQASKVLACPGLARPRTFSLDLSYQQDCADLPGAAVFPVAPSFRRPTFLQK